jgi:hypothetical protein
MAILLCDHLEKVSRNANSILLGSETLTLRLHAFFV